MTGKNTDKEKDRVKEAAGELIGERRLENEGRDDQGKSPVNNAVDSVVGTLSARKTDKRSR